MTAADPRAEVEHAGALWRDANFLRFWAATSISVFGSRITGLALPLAAIEVLDARAFELGLLGTFGFLPFLVVGLVVGVWVDQLRRRPILIAADILRAALLASIPIAFLAGVLTIWQVYAVVFVAGICDVFFDVAYDAYVPSLVGRERLVEANSKVEASQSTARLAGPAVAGLLIGLFSAPIAIVVDVASYLVSGTLLARISRVEPTAPPRAAVVGRRTAALWHQSLHGLRYVFASPYLRGLAGTTAMFNLFNTMLFTLLILYATQQLGLSAATIGLVFSVSPIGALVGIFIAGRLARRIGLGRAIVLGMVLSGGAFVLVPLAPQDAALPYLVAFEFLMGLGIPIYNINQRSLRQAMTPDAMLGRMIASMRFLVWGTIPIGSFLGGVLGSTIGILPTLWIAAAGTSLAFVFVLASPVRNLRTAADAGLPDAG